MNTTMTTGIIVCTEEGFADGFEWLEHDFSRLDDDLVLDDAGDPLPHDTCMERIETLVRQAEALGWIATDIVGSAKADAIIARHAPRLWAALTA